MAFDLAIIEKQALNGVDSKRVDTLASSIKSNEYSSISKFGTGVAEQISAFANKHLQSDATDQINRTQELMTTVDKLMQQFELKDLEPDIDKSFLDKVLHSAERKLKKIVSKYSTLNKEVEKVYIIIKSYVSDIEQSNQKLLQEYDAEMDYYRNLKEHIVAGEQAQSLMESQGADEMAQSLLVNKINDLRCAENIAVQSLMMLKVREFNNINLSRKIDNAFIITLPLLQQQLNQAIELKKQSIQANALNMLDERTNEMIKRNTQNGMMIAKQVASMANSSSIKMSTIEQTYSTIMNGIKEVQQIQESTLAENKSNIEKLKGYSLTAIQNNQ